MREKSISRKRFICMGAATGAGVAGFSLITSCGSDVPLMDKVAGSVKVPAEKGLVVEAGDVIAEVSELAEGSSVRFVDAKTEEPGVLVRLADGSFVAYSALCTHEDCPVFYQEKSRKIACPCHGAVFDPANGGAAEVGPAQVPLGGIEVEVRDGKVVLL